VAERRGGRGGGGRKPGAGGAPRPAGGGRKPAKDGAPRGDLPGPRSGSKPASKLTSKPASKPTSKPGPGGAHRGGGGRKQASAAPARGYGSGWKKAGPGAAPRDDAGEGDGPRLPRAKKSLGQNFLVDVNLQRKIVEAVSPGSDDEVMEIGPGPGALTSHLAGRVRRLVLVELDNGLAAALQARYAGDPSVEVIHEDVLKVPLERVSADPARLKVIGNIPYNITTPILFSLLERRVRPAEIVLMVQREVADRILAPEGGKQYGALAVGVRAVADAERVLQVPRGAFRPVPDVESSVVRIVPHAPARLTEAEEADLRVLTRFAFGQRRKQFQRILRDAYGLGSERVEAIGAELGIDLRDRPETFPPETFIALARVLSRG
jgi:16S rRNA (adenine1518-N6/adenine1519-N6)-dimethyltransferase